MNRVYTATPTARFADLGLKYHELVQNAKWEYIKQAHSNGAFSPQHFITHRTP